MTRMFPTVEVRWFYKGEIPAEILVWFQRSGQTPEPQTPREDYYLCLPDRDSLGVKLREGKIEVKQRSREYGLVSFQKQIAGRVEHWRKWSYLLAESEDAVADIGAPDEAWMGVKKDRQLQSYKVTTAGQVLTTSTDDFLERGCEVELGRITLGEKQWWSLCLEAFGRADDLKETLLLTAEHIFAGASFTLEAGNSYGYAKLLKDACQSEGC